MTDTTAKKTAAKKPAAKAAPKAPTAAAAATGNTVVTAGTGVGRIAQVIGNVLQNAAKYTPEGTPVTLRAIPSAGREGKPVSRSTGRVVRIEIADTGPGIHPDDSRRVFEKFGRGRDREGRKVPGAGLGLYLSRRIVRVHGSDLSVRSVPGEGSTFSFTLEAAPGNASG